MSYKEIFIFDLEALLSGNMKPSEFREKYIDGPSPINIDEKTNGEIPDLTPVIGHFITDEDLRIKDSEYEKMQKDSLAELIKLIKENAPREKLLKIKM